uniref:Uncharacterized protein n=1 Tax=Pyrodinium bahamense TaxID=73915 RepID=A0A7S0BBQ5_9DINO
MPARGEPEEAEQHAGTGERGGRLRDAGAPLRRKSGRDGGKALAPEPGAGRLLPRGSRCCYMSRTSGWYDTEVEEYNADDGTYNLDIRDRAAPCRISPAPFVAAAEAWPPGTLVAYFCASERKWVPAVVHHYNESAGTYNLDVDQHAHIQCIRARVADFPFGRDALPTPSCSSSEDE